MSVTCKSELRCSLVGLTPVFIPFRSFRRIPGASVAIFGDELKISLGIFVVAILGFQELSVKKKEKAW
jgi:hypothetical protein